MGRLLEFLFANRDAMLFWLLELLALWILVRFNELQTNVFNQIALSLGAKVQEVNARVQEYWNLSEQNAKLFRENLVLRRQLVVAHTAEENYRLRQADFNGLITAPDSSSSDTVSRYRFLPCRAINNTLYTHYNYITLDVGRKDGVTQDMGVVSTDGVAGMVVAVGENYAMAISLLNKKFRVNARIKGREIRGVFQWKGGDARFGSLQYVPQHFHVFIGDTVISSSYSSIFPEGLTLGTVESVSSNEPNGFYDIKIRLAADFHNIDHLYLVQRIHKDEIDSLQKSLR